jgi:hypothetical protein
MSAYSNHVLAFSIDISELRPGLAAELIEHLTAIQNNKKINGFEPELV